MEKRRARIEALRALSREADIYCANGCGEWDLDEAEEVYEAIRELGLELSQQADLLQSRIDSVSEQEGPK